MHIMTLQDMVKHFRQSNGLHHGIRIFIGTVILWLLLGHIQGLNPLWAVISLIIVTEQNVETTMSNFRFRLINTIIGCVTGLLFLIFIHHARVFMLPAALMASVCASSFLIRTPYGWRIAAITTAIIIIPSLADGSRMVGMEVALGRTIEVFLGSATAVLVSWLFTIMKTPAYEDYYH